MSKKKMIAVTGCLFCCYAFQTRQLLGQSAPPPTTSPAADGNDDEDSKTSENFRSEGNAWWNKKQNYPKALETFQKGIKRFPKSVRLLVALTATSIDFGSQHPAKPAGRQAFKDASAAIDTALRLIDDGTGEDVDDSARDALVQMRSQLP